ncbi:MAG: tripartite tricarboxylate transporter substrate binding protein [Burkholderiales bacterium]|nr:tripartite tricarboxylate transporter substrate binding protein [Burkholderiales bacterium]
MNRFHHFTRRAAVLSGLALAASAALAQGGAPVRLLVGYAAGGPVDAAARLIAPALAKELGSPVQVENKPGANATLAGDMVAKGTPDGTLLWFAASPTVTISPNVMKKMAFDPGKDLTPLAPVLSYYNVLVINKDLPFQNLKELTDYAKANPEKVAYGSAGIGGSNHLCGELFAARSQVKLTHVPYKGNAPAMTDVMGGQLTMMFDIIGSARNYIAGGKVRAIAVTSPQRNASLPSVPTMSEAGLPGFDVGGWYGVYGPANTPAAVTARLNQAITKALAQPELKAKLEEMGYELWTGAPKLLADRAQKERAMWATVTKGIEID